ncbi:unnamed protein product, partial [Candidula unifasciata]
ITEALHAAMAKDTRVSFDPPAQAPNKPNNKARHGRGTERQISYEDAENCVNEMSESFPALSTRAQRLMRQVSGSFNNRTMKVALILSVILNLLLGIPFGIFFGFWMSQKNEASLSPSSREASLSSSSSLDSLKRLVGEKTYSLRELCFPCSDTDLELDNRVKVNSKNSICCTEDKILHVQDSPYYCVSGDVFRRRCMGGDLSLPVALPCKSGSESRGAESAAHLMLDVDETKARMKNPSHNEIPLVWITRDPEHRTFVGKDVSYSSGHITIHKSGKYHLYSHMTLSSNENPLSEDEGERIIVHSLLWNSRGVSKSLLFSQVTLKRNEVKSTNIEGSFELLDGDVISVYLSHPSFLKNIRPANVFGLFMLL